MNPMKEKTNNNMTDFNFIVNTEVLNFESASQVFKTLGKHKLIKIGMLKVERNKIQHPYNIFQPQPFKL